MPARGIRSWLVATLCAIFALTSAAVAAPPKGPDLAHKKLDTVRGHRFASGEAQPPPGGVVAKNFEVLGHNDLGQTELSADVWVHGDFAYVGTWVDPCNGRGVKILDVSDLSNPTLIGTLAGREGTSAEDIVVREVSTSFFTGDLLGVGIQRCGEDPALDEQQFGLELWDVSDPTAPVKLSELGLTTGGGGLHELDMFVRGSNVYVLAAVPFGEWFDPEPAGDFRIIDVTNPELPVQVSDWGAGENGFSLGPFDGQGSFGATFGHSARASADGTKAYVSYWDLGVLTFDITDVTDPVLLSRTQYEPTADGDAHSMTPFESQGGREFIFQNDEDFDARDPAVIRVKGDKKDPGVATESPGAPALWLQPGHKVKAGVVEAANQGCDVADYPADTAGSIAVVRTPVPFFDPPGAEEPLCQQQEQEAAAEAAGARAVVHDFIAENTSPQFFDSGDVGIPALFTDHDTAQAMVAAGKATLEAGRPSWGYLRIFDAESGEQVAKFDRAPNVHTLPAPDGFWSIHNTEVVEDRAYVSWYSNGIIALDLKGLVKGKDKNPKMVGQFVPTAGIEGFPDVWGVVIRPSDNVIFVSDLGSGLWIIRPTGRAAPGG